MKTYIVTYTATYDVTAESLEEATDIAKNIHRATPNGNWDTVVNYYDSNNYNTLGEK